MIHFPFFLSDNPAIIDKPLLHIKILLLLEACLWPVVEDGLVGVEAAAWLRAWAGMSIEAKDGLLDNSGKKQEIWMVTRKTSGQVVTWHHTADTSHK